MKTERLTLEPLGTKHLKTACIYSIDPENTKMMCFLPSDNEDEVMDYLRNCEIQWKKNEPEYLDAAVMLDGVHIGGISIEFVENRTAGELGWIINKNYWGKGYAAEAMRAFIGYFKERFGISHFIAHADAENKASIRVMEKLGMKFVSENTGRKNRRSDELRSEYLYELRL